MANFSNHNGGIFIPPDDDDSELFSNDSSIEFFRNLINELEEEDTTSSSAPKEIVPRNRGKGNETLMQDYFDDSPKYKDREFRYRFRMSKDLFLKVVDDIKTDNPWFEEGYDGRKKKSFTPIQKITSAIKQLATGNTPDEYDEYLCMSTRTSRECLQFICEAVIRKYGSEYLRRPTSHDIALLYQWHEEKHHIPGMLGSLDCTHLQWRMCPRELQGMYTRGDHGVPTVMCEAVASQDLWFWHAYCGPPGSLNDINVLQQPPLLLTQKNSTAPVSPFTVNGHTYKRGYYLTDGAYPTWSIFVKTYPFPVDPIEKNWKKLQEGATKDVERAFVVLKGKWGILIRSMRAMTVDKIRKVVYTCMILHNMILKDDGNAISPVYIRDPPVQPRLDERALIEIMNSKTHFRLRHDLQTHIGNQDLPYLEESSDEE